MPRIRRTPESRVEDCSDTWWAWRAACTTVEEAYHAWTTARVAQRALAFARYRAAPDREEERADRHAAHVAGRLGPTVEFTQTV